MMIRQAPKHQALGYLQKIKGPCGFCNDYLVGRLKSFSSAFFLISQPKTYIVGTQKKRLNEIVLLSTQNIWLN